MRVEEEKKQQERKKKVKKGGSHREVLAENALSNLGSRKVRR